MLFNGSRSWGSLDMGYMVHNAQNKCCDLVISAVFNKCSDVQVLCVYFISFMSLSRSDFRRLPPKIPTTRSEGPLIGLAMSRDHDVITKLRHHTHKCTNCSQVFSFCSEHNHTAAGPTHPPFHRSHTTHTAIAITILTIVIE